MRTPVPRKLLASLLTAALAGSSLLATGCACADQTAASRAHEKDSDAERHVVFSKPGILDLAPLDSSQSNEANYGVLILDALLLPFILFNHQDDTHTQPPGDDHFHQAMLDEQRAAAKKH